MAVSEQTLQTDLAAVQASLATLSADLAALPAAAVATILTSAAGSLTDAARRVWTLVAASDSSKGLQLAIGSKADFTTNGVVLAVLDANGALWQQNNQGGW